MKEVKNIGIGLGCVLGVIFNILVISICIWQQIAIFNFVVILVVFNSFIYLISYKGYFYYKYDRKYLIIRNSWNLLYYKKISIKEIREIELKAIAYRGLTIILYLNSGKKLFITSNDIDKEKINQMINDLESYK